jgi:hypothetical protein
MLIMGLGGSVYTMGLQRNTEALVVDSKETSLEVNAEKSKYMIIPVCYPNYKD